MRVRLVGLLALMALVLASCGGVSPDAAGPSEGIQVHGDWTIDIYNEDGSLDRHVEFANAFQGETALTSWLSHQRTVGPWRISLYSADSATWPCLNDAGEKRPCTIFEQFDPPQTDTSSVNYTLSVTTADLGGAQGADESLVLGGSITASATGEISVVQTTAALCAIDDLWPTCTEEEAISDTFTQKDLETAIPVTEGQLIEVEVVISFTSG